jgi:6-pyruvoyltetrahydropterin/6-carboxytetrahydropterin synthase
MYRVGITRKFTARHFLIGDFGDETVPHSHEYSVDWILSVKQLDENGFSVDISLLEDVLEKILTEIDNKLLNEMPYFRSRQPSVENSASFIYESLFSELERHGFQTGNLIKTEVKVWESETAWASFVFMF